MSMQMMVDAMKIKVGGSATKLVLIKLADNANDQGECWPSYKNISDHCEMTRRSVMTHIKKLEVMGLLRKEHRFGENGNKSNVYYLTLNGGEKTSPPDEKTSPPSEKISPPDEKTSPPSEKISPPDEKTSLPPGEKISPRTSHSLEPVKESKDILSSKCDESDNSIAKQVIRHLNAVTGVKYRVCASNVGLINARIAEGFTPQDLILVIDYKQFEWGRDAKWAQYVRPSTLFQPSKFNGYLQAARIAAQQPMSRAISSADFYDTAWAKKLDEYL